MSGPDRSPSVADDRILAAFARHDASVLTVEDAAEVLPLDAGAVRGHLVDLEDRSSLVRTETQSGAPGWRLAPSVEDEIAPGGPPVDAEAGADPDPMAPSDHHSDEASDPDPMTPSEFATAERDDRDTRFPDEGSPDRHSRNERPDGSPPSDAHEADRDEEEFAEVLYAAYDYLREHGRATRSDFETDVFPAAPGDYDAPDEWWASVVRPGLPEFPGVESSDDGEEWRYTGG